MIVLKPTNIIVVAIFLILSFLSLCSVEAQQIRLLHGHPSGSPLDLALIEMARSVLKELGGGLEIEVFPEGNIEKPNAVVGAVQAGQFEMAMAPIHSLRRVVPGFKVYNLIFLFPNLDAVDQFGKGSEGQQLLGLLDGVGLKGLGYAHRGMLQFAAQKPIRTPEDLEGRKINVQDWLVAEQLRTMGANAVRVRTSKIYSALMTGLFDATTTTTEGIMLGGLKEVAPALTPANYSYVGEVLIMGSKYWKALTPRARYVIETTANAVFEQYNREQIYAEQAMKAKLEFVPFDESDRNKWLREVPTTWGDHVVDVPSKIVVQTLDHEYLSGSKPVRDLLDRLTKQPEKEIYWNTWFEEFDQPVSSSQILPNHPYTFVADLSRFDLSHRGFVSQTELSPTIIQDIKQAIEGRKPGLHIWIRPVLVNAVPEPGEAPSQKMSIFFDRLIHPKNPQVAALNDSDFHEFAKAGRIGLVGPIADDRPFRLRLQTGDAGCGAVALSIWDSSGRRPLDHLVYRFRIGKSPQSGLRCQVDPLANNFYGGFNTLLKSTILTARNPESEPIAAAFHVFEVKDVTNDTMGLALFLMPNDKTNGEPDLWSWQMADPLSRYLSGTAFTKGLSDAQEAAILAGSSRDTYAKVAKDLKDRLFSGSTKQDQDSANAAFDSLKGLVENATKPPLVLARLVGAKGELLYLPLRLLSAGGPTDAPLKKPFLATQPLPRERYVSGITCVEPWAFALPEAMNAGVKFELPPNAKDWPPWLFALIRKFDEFKRYCEPSGPESDTGEGLMLVAHQANGELSFKSAPPVVTAGSIQRQYSEGSVAVLATCEAAGLDNENRLVLKQLNKQGADTIIAAPYKVNLDYGVALGEELASAIHDFRTLPSNPPPKIMELFETAAIRAANNLSKSLPGMPRHLEDMRFEFQIMGDYGTRLCGPN
jgi:C4-dicarboxylate-binding protein DctP